MKNDRTILIFAAMLMAVFCGGCGMSGGSDANGNAKAGGSSNAAKPSAPAIEITADALGKEWMANRAAADAKYKGKDIRFTGSVQFAQQIGDEVFIKFESVPFDVKTGGVVIECVSAPTKDAKMLVEGGRLNLEASNHSANNAKPPQMKANVKGTYDSSVDRTDGSIALKPCEVTMY